jgi:hypothetical protein
MPRKPPTSPMNRLAQPEQAFRLTLELHPLLGDV